MTQFLTRVNRLLAGVTDYRTIPYTVSYVASGSDQRTIYYIEVISNTSELNELAQRIHKNGTLVGHSRLTLGGKFNYYKSRT